MNPHNIDFGGPEIPALVIAGVGNITNGQYWQTHEKDRGFMIVLWL